MTSLTQAGQKVLNLEDVRQHFHFVAAVHHSCSHNTSYQHQDRRINNNDYAADNN